MKTIDQRFNTAGDFAVDIDDSGRINLDYGWRLKYRHYPVDSVLVPALEIREISFWYEGQKEKAGIIGNALKEIAAYIKKHKRIPTVGRFVEAHYFTNLGIAPIAES